MHLRGQSALEILPFVRIMVYCLNVMGIALIYSMKKRCSWCHWSRCMSATSRFKWGLETAANKTCSPGVQRYSAPCKQQWLILLSFWDYRIGICGVRAGCSSCGNAPPLVKCLPIKFYVLDSAAFYSEHERRECRKLLYYCPCMASSRPESGFGATDDRSNTSLIAIPGGTCRGLQVTSTHCRVASLISVSCCHLSLSRPSSRLLPILIGSICTGLSPRRSLACFSCFCQAVSIRRQSLGFSRIEHFSESVPSISGSRSDH